ncbi:MAG TPA: tetratricopeptide repeat protein [Bryobacteraceae bacterium]|nr:tetratricopeptide repeat protein [Bryobacteraceae bacterium]
MVLILCAAALFLSQAAAQDLSAAARQAERAVQQQPTATNYQKLGLARYLQNQFAPALEAFTQALRLDPKLWPSHLFLGVCRYRLNQFAGALEALQHADRLAPPEAQGRDDLEYWLGATHVALRSPLPGLVALERLLRRTPHHVAGLQLATETHAETASGIWNGIAERDFASSAGQEVHGYAMESEANVNAAMEAFGAAARLNPKRPGPHAALSRLHLRRGDLPQAAAAIQKELALNPVSGEANLQAGMLAISQGTFADAVRPLSRASDLMPDNDEPLLALAQVHLALKNPAKAVEVAKRAVALDARSVAAHELAVTALLASGDQAGADAELARWRSLTQP